MPRPTSRSSDAAWAKAFQQVVQTREKLPPGTGWLTRYQIEKTLGFGSCKTFAILRRLIDEGQVERFSGMAIFRGRLTNQEWYRLTTPSATKRSGRTK